MWITPKCYLWKKKTETLKIRNNYQRLSKNDDGFMNAKHSNDADDGDPYAAGHGDHGDDGSGECPNQGLPGCKDADQLHNGDHLTGNKSN